jgi:hypothetical protein
MIRKLQSGEYRLYSRKKDAKTGKRKNLGTFSSREAAQKHERAVQYFKRAGVGNLFLKLFGTEFRESSILKCRGYSQ